MNFSREKGTCQGVPYNIHSSDGGNENPSKGKELSRLFKFAKASVNSLSPTLWKGQPPHRCHILANPKSEHQPHIIARSRLTR
ncbi:hypothetical protein SLA2020_487170 [Shorea laevis]